MKELEAKKTIMHGDMQGRIQDFVKGRGGHTGRVVTVQSVKYEAQAFWLGEGGLGACPPPQEILKKQRL